MSGPGDTPDQGSARDVVWAQLHRPLRPRAGRIAPMVAAVLWVAALAFLAVGIPGAGVGDAVGFAAIGVGSVWFLARLWGVSVIPGEDGLLVRNLVRSRSLAWAQVVAVNFGRDSTFGALDLTDGTSLSVMAIQAADGSFAAAEATRLATLVEVHARAA